MGNLKPALPFLAASCWNFASAWVVVPNTQGSLFRPRSRSCSSDSGSRNGVSAQRRDHHRRGRIVLPLSSEDSASSTTDDATTEESLDLESLMEMDCFVYSRNISGGDKKLELGVLEESVVQPICAWTMEEAFDDYIEFVVDEEDRYSLDAEDVTIHSLVPADSLSYGSRQVGGGKGPGNPHGEESELLYYIRKDQLEGIEVTIKPELEITW